MLNSGERLNIGYDNYIMKHGGIYFSPGFGLRIFISDLLQIVPSIEYSLEGFSYEQSGSYYQDYEIKDNNSFLKLNIGIALQYK